MIVGLLLTATLIGSQADWTQLATAQELERRFVAELSDPEHYFRRVQTETGFFPEGDLFGVVFPALAFASLAERSTRGVEHVRRFEVLVAKAISLVEERVGAPLSEMSDTRSEGTYLSHLNLLLSVSLLIGSGDRFESQSSALSGLLNRDLIERGGRPIESWPGIVWPYDTTVAIASLHLRAQATGTRRYDAAISQHLKWFDEHGRDSANGLPASQLDPATFDIVGGPRGCDLSLRIAMLALVDSERAERLYASLCAASLAGSVGMVWICRIPGWGLRGGRRRFRAHRRWAGRRGDGIGTRSDAICG